MQDVSFIFFQLSFKFVPLSLNIFRNFEIFPNSFQFPLCEGNFSGNLKVDFAGTVNCTGKFSFERIYYRHF